MEGKKQKNKRDKKLGKKKGEVKLKCLLNISSPALPNPYHSTVSAYFICMHGQKEDKKV